MNLSMIAVLIRYRQGSYLSLSSKNILWYTLSSLILCQSAAILSNNICSITCENIFATSLQNFLLKLQKAWSFSCTATSPSAALDDILYLAFHFVLPWNYIYIYNWFRNCCDYTVLITGITFMTDICICYGFILNSRYGSLFMDFLGFPYQHIWILRVWGVFFLPIWNQSYLPVTQETPQI